MTAPAGAPRATVIVGTGLAGYTLARELRRTGYAGQLALVTRDDGAFYSKPMLSNALAQKKTAESLVITPAEQMAAALHASIHTDAEVTAIDLRAQQIQLAHTVLPYDALVLACGADPIRLSLQGSAADAVLSINDRLDYARFRDALVGARHVAILGGGLIGCEFANDLRTAGHDVTVIDPAPWPLGRLVPAAVGNAVTDALAATGVTWRLGQSVTAVDRAPDGTLLLRFDNGEQRACDLVLSAVGLAPRTRLAAAAGLTIKRGIVTDNYLQASATGIYALGDCAETGGQVRPFVLPITHGARALAQTLCGTPTPVRYPAMPVVVKTPALPVVVCPPAPQTLGDWCVTTERRGVRALFHDQHGRLAGFALAGTATGEKQALAVQLS